MAYLLWLAFAMFETMYLLLIVMMLYIYMGVVFIHIYAYESNKYQLRNYLQYGQSIN